ncbi:hypothetical protein RRG08_006302 [Elysia crispata]|uniref:Uncharacterized protein n=1 Tax=Elysia crispata TaxID=231223 RepID=A0AAE0YQ38_9GAST|nr:hypothetical protein RRG08_006302 [Elysia crispata]
MRDEASVKHALFTFVTLPEAESRVNPFQLFHRSKPFVACDTAKLGPISARVSALGESPKFLSNAALERVCVGEASTHLIFVS